jgi:DNA polymerase-3 subunit epsilon
MREVLFDTETTGFEPDHGDRVVELACVEIINLMPTGRTFHRYVNPERDVPEEVVKVHGLTAKFLADKPRFGEIAADLVAFFEDSPIVAHNAEFDRKFLNGELQRAGRRLYEKERFVDTLALARRVLPAGQRLSLDALATHFQRKFDTKFDLAQRKGSGGHGALIDARILGEVYLQLRGGRERALSFNDQDQTATNETTASLGKATAVKRPVRPHKLPPALTAEEAAAHRAFIAGLGPQALWVLNKKAD